NDITLISPVYLPSPTGSPVPPLLSHALHGTGEGPGVGAAGTLLGYVANLAHHVDVGGGAPGSIGAFREVFQEGIIIPAVKIMQSGKIIDDVFRLVLAQIRSKRETAGDFRAQMAANATGTRRLNALVQRLGVDAFNTYI